jgi:hypothetical protein
MSQKKWEHLRFLLFGVVENGVTKFLQHAFKIGTGGVEMFHRREELLRVVLLSDPCIGDFVSPGKLPQSWVYDYLLCHLMTYQLVGDLPEQVFPRLRTRRVELGKPLTHGVVVLSDDGYEIIGGSDATH